MDFRDWIHHPNTKAMMDAMDVLRKDAERYRWLRSGKYEGVIAPYTYWECGCRGEELDAAIDARMMPN